MTSLSPLFGSRTSLNLVFLRSFLILSFNDILSMARSIVLCVTLSWKHSLLLGQNTGIIYFLFKIYGVICVSKNMFEISKNCTRWRYSSSDFCPLFLFFLSPSALDICTEKHFLSVGCDNITNFWLPEVMHCCFCGSTTRLTFINVFTTV